MLCLYRFTAAKRGDDYRGSFYFLVDNERVAFVERYDENATTKQGSSTINLYLTAGQLVRIENYISANVWGTVPDSGIWSWFTGFLLFAA